MATHSLSVPEEFTVHHVRGLAQGLIVAVCNEAELSLDLSAVSHIDTAGIQLLLALRRESARALTRLEFANPSPAVREMLEFYRLGNIFDTPARPLVS